MRRMQIGVERLSSSLQSCWSLRDWKQKTWSRPACEKLAEKLSIDMTGLQVVRDCPEEKFHAEVAGV
eukprot:746551-Hanusia_phi.AAC.5